MGITTPILDERTSDDIYRQVLELARRYCPELDIPDDPDHFDPDDPSLVILKLFSKRAEYLIDQFNKISDKQRLAFLDFVGVDLLPAKPSKVPLTFYLSEGTRSCAIVPAGTRVASSNDPDVIFETIQGLSVAHSGLEAVYSINPWEDRYTDHSVSVHGAETGFNIFGGDIDEKYFDHVLYIGDDTVLDLQRSPTRLTIHILGTNLSKGHFYHWFDGSGNSISGPDFSDIVQDRDIGAERLDISLVHGEHSNVKKSELSSVDGTESYWLHVRPEDGTFDKGMKLPAISRILADMTVEEILPDGALLNDTPLDVIKGFYPFGEEPKKGDTLYIGSEEAFSKQGAEITFNIELETEIGSRDVELQWEHWDGIGWQLLDVVDSTEAFTESGKITLPCPDVVPLEINGQLNRWIRVKILSDDGYGEKTEAKSVGRIGRLLNKIKEFLGKVKDALLKILGWIKKTLVPEKVSEKATDKASEVVETSKSKKPNPIMRFIFTKTRRFKRKSFRRARLKIIPRSVYGPRGLIKPKNAYLIRRFFPHMLKGIKAKIIEIIRGKSSEALPFISPFIQSAKMSYDYKDVELSRKRIFNNYRYEDFRDMEEPYKRSPDEMPGIYFGFEQNIANTTITLFFAVKKPHYNEEPITIQDPEYGKSDKVGNNNFPLVWEFHNGQNWEEINTEDETGFIKTDGIVTLYLSADVKSIFRFGRDMYWIRARVAGGYGTICPKLEGIFQNTVWALNNVTISDEVLGSGNGEPGLTFSFSNSPVLEKEIIEVKEADIPSKDEIKMIESEWEKDALRLVEDGGEIKEVWVRWSEVRDFALSGSLSRHYVLDRSAGTVTFGDGVRGMIPQRGMNNIVARYYQSGGGKEGDLPSGAVTSLKKTIPNIDSVVNHVSTYGGFDQEYVESVVTRGAYTIKNRDRAVTKEDFERLTLEVSQYIARARCLSENGTLMVIIVPGYEGDAPIPDAGLLDSVRNYLMKRALLTVCDTIEVLGPDYSKIDVDVKVRPVSLGEGTVVSEMIKKRVRMFLHPLHGGYVGEGWDFGQPVPISQMAAVIEDIEGVDYVNEIVLTKSASEQIEERATGIEQLPIERNALPCAGAINVEIAG